MSASVAEHIGGNKSCFLTTTALDNFYILGTEKFVALLAIDITNEDFTGSNFDEKNYQ